MPARKKERKKKMIYYTHNDPAYREIVKSYCEGRIELDEVQLKNASCLAQKNIADYDMGEDEAIMDAVEQVSDYRFPEYHPEDVKEYSPDSILKELQNLTSRVVQELKLDETSGYMYGSLANGQKFNVTELLAQQIRS